MKMEQGDLLDGLEVEIWQGSFSSSNQFILRLGVVKKLDFCAFSPEGQQSIWVHSSC
jgi:autotransporter translocation and assembly factor TamB